MYSHIPKLDLYLKLKAATRDYLDGNGSIASIADAVPCSFATLAQVLVEAGITDVAGKPVDGIDPQDILNAIFLSTTRSVLSKKALLSRS